MKYHYQEILKYNDVDDIKLIGRERDAGWFYFHQFIIYKCQPKAGHSARYNKESQDESTKSKSIFLKKLMIYK